jgi:hypothetical protein
VWLAAIAIGTSVVSAVTITHAPKAVAVVPAQCGGPSPAACTTLKMVDSDMANDDAADLVELATPESVECPSTQYKLACGTTTATAVQVFGIDEAGTTTYMDRNEAIGYVRNYFESNGPWRPAGVAWASHSLSASFSGAHVGVVRLVLRNAGERWDMTVMSLNP